MNSRFPVAWPKASAAVVLFSGAVFLSQADGIPEPSLVLYGVVHDTVSGVRLNIGSLEWTFRPIAGGEPVIATGQLTNLNDQFSYVLFVSMETPLAGQPPTPNTLGLAPVPALYDRGDIQVNGIAATVLPPASSMMTLGRTDRGKVERVDLSISLPVVDLDENGLPDAWEAYFFGENGIDPNADADGDGLTNTEEWRAGTDPIDPQSVFEFIHVEATPEGGITIKWSSVIGKTYSILRSPTLTEGFVPIQTGVTATPPVNSYHDGTAVSEGPYFYLLQVEE